MLSYSPDVGPLIKIVSKMAGDVFNFLILYCILTLMYAVVGTYLYRGKLDDFSGL